MNTDVDVEEIETTKSEKVLALVLTIFLLIGGIWAYQKIDDVVADALAPPPGAASLGPRERAALDAAFVAQRAVSSASQAESTATRNLEFRREAYRTALDARQPAGRLEREYRSAQASLDSAQQRLRAARTQLRSAQPAAQSASRHQQEASRRANDRRQLVAFFVRLAFVVAMVVLGYWLLGRLRNRRSRYLPAALAFVGFAAILAFVMATDYVTDYIDPIDLGPLVLSVVGIALTLVAFAALQRYLARRVPFRRVRRLECPFCGYPVRGTDRCEGCGREVVARCASCEAPRRVGTAHCGACGNT